MTNIFKWLTESNRPKHMLAGIIAYVVAYGCSIPLTCTTDRAALVALMVTCAVALTAEIKDHLWGGKFDFLDALATTLVPIIVTVFILILHAI